MGQGAHSRPISVGANVAAFDCGNFSTYCAQLSRHLVQYFPNTEKVDGESE
jgi:hypothetical protein